ncbi:hypothetical protein RRG08_042024 [Elysia crispata]|uniref:Uncharacterized protein n=1 Tax=Elysia crispata TaxID=231223 RepID=A0AAE1DBM4_9GAST|nr:hypothetical protein RRG08_042024 [Elysia crispata]
MCRSGFGQIDRNHNNTFSKKPISHKRLKLRIHRKTCVGSRLKRHAGQKVKVELSHSASVILSTQQNTLQIGQNFGHRETRIHACWLLAENGSAMGLCG